LRRCQTFQTMVRIEQWTKHLYAGSIEESRLLSIVFTACRALGTCRTPQPCSNAHAASRDWSGSIAEALCAGFPTVVRRRFGELRSGSAGLVIAKERLNRGRMSM
jgi:hypothetical protein